MATYTTKKTRELVARIAQNLNRHLVLPLLEFLQERQLYLEEQIFKSKIELLSKTNMVDYAMDIHKSLYHTEDVPQDMIERRAEVVARLKALEEGAAPLVAFLQNANTVQELRADKQYCLQMLNDRFQEDLKRSPHFLPNKVSSPPLLPVTGMRVYFAHGELSLFCTREMGFIL
uniref:Eukaryotic translation initiation factor 3 subunit E N-terminal domain-containing protein n=1 Tax=Manihot esculenta TaxID=3983 RepID=A0A199UAE5_MANES